MRIITNLKTAAGAFVQSYEAAGLMGLFFGIGIAFALGAAVIWVGQIFGPIISSLIFAAIFLIAGLVMKLISGSKEKEAETRLRSATQGPMNAARAVSQAFSPSAQAGSGAVLSSALVFVLLATALYLGSSKSSAHSEA